MSKTKTFRRSSRQRTLRRLIPVFIIAVLVLALAVGIALHFSGGEPSDDKGVTPPWPKHTTTTAPTTTTTTLPSFSTETVTQLKDALSAKNALLYDITNERVLFDHNAEVVCSPASLTKIMTAAVAAKYATEDNFVVGREVYLTDPQASSAYLKIGMELTLPQMLQALLLPSGGDAAYCLAVHTAKRLYPEEELSNFDAATRFCDLMNEELKAIGANDSHFVNPDGIYHTFHVTTANDILKILRFAWQYDAVREALCTPRASFKTPSGHDLTYTNTNRLLNTNFPATYYANAIGGKTGFTDEAGYCLASVAEKDGTQLVAIVLGCADENLRFTEPKLLYEAGFALK
ncbi:MAG: D-alanyl-D-alanine carboxypeptidase [Ruminococcaceae bacterium]|nr:D-alanyl-D-alanine carboxypeptidase [Oscillospiraceae bacterium]